MQEVQSPLHLQVRWFKKWDGGGGVAILKNVLSFFLSVSIAFFVILYPMSTHFLIRLEVDCKFKMKKLYLEN